MHHNIEGGTAVSGVIPEFEGNCLADLRANGGK